MAKHKIVQLFPCRRKTGGIFCSLLSQRSLTYHHVRKLHLSNAHVYLNLQKIHATRAETSKKPPNTHDRQNAFTPKTTVTLPDLLFTWRQQSKPIGVGTRKVLFSAPSVCSPILSPRLPTKLTYPKQTKSGNVVSCRHNGRTTPGRLLFWVPAVVPPRSPERLYNGVAEAVDEGQQEEDTGRARRSG